MQGIVQVAIGMIFVFSLLSILVTTLNTVIANFLRWRSQHLKSAIESLITDPEVQAQFLSHPLINMVRTEMITPQQVATTATAEVAAAQVRSAPVSTVDYIDPKTFAQVLSSILAEKAGLELYGPLLLAVDGLAESPSKTHLLDMVYGLQNTGIGLTDLRGAILTLPPEQQAPVLAALKPLEDRSAAAQLAPGDGSRLLPVLDGLRKVNDDAFRRALKVVVASAQNIDQAQQNLEDWFNQRMDQLSDSYKRHLTNLTLVIGLLLALMLNADSLQMARALWEDPTLRDTVVATASAAAAQQAQQAQSAPNPEATPDVNGANSQAVGEATAQIADSLTQLTNLNLPIGWEFTPIDGGCFPTDTYNPPITCNSQRNLWLFIPGNDPYWFGSVIRKIIGFAVTVIAIGQGAPFWFDLIRRLVNPGGG